MARSVQRYLFNVKTEQTKRPDERNKLNEHYKRVFVVESCSLTDDSGCYAGNHCAWS